MKRVNLQIENGVIVGYTEFPLDETKKIYEFSEEQLLFISNNICLIDENLKIIESLELKKQIESLRAKREPLLIAFDKYKSNVNYGVEFEDEEQRNIIIKWYNEIKNLNEKYIIKDENIPNRIKYYL